MTSRRQSAEFHASSDSNANPIDLTTLTSLLAVSGLLILLLLGTVLHCNRKRATFKGHERLFMTLQPPPMECATFQK
uniref:Uncharacterized protein n=1 Tax=Magallana gigas TaxID=29159 RepID=K1PSV1_MAGGI